MTYLRGEINNSYTKTNSDYYSSWPVSWVDITITDSSERHYDKPVAIKEAHMTTELLEVMQEANANKETGN